MVGRTLMHYKVVAELGAGGMGVVYEALDLRLDRRVALKILPADKSDDQQRRARFLHEARTASALNDPHIVTIFDIFTVDDTDVLVMELVPGRTLRDILNDGPLALAKALDIALQVAEGVGVAHTAGIVHRDLKPGNVMVTERGRVKVLDFGLAKLVGSGSLADQPTMLAPATVAGMLLGTVDYMSPEQARGDPIDARSDVFSLGAMLYEMIAGARPFTSGHALGVLHEIAYGAIVPVRTRRPDATADIERIVLHALERDVTRRYQTMEAFSSDLRRTYRDVLANAPTAVDAPAAVLVPPPLPPHAAQPTVNQSGSTYRAVAGTIRVLYSIHDHPRPARDSARAAVRPPRSQGPLLLDEGRYRHLDRVHVQLDAHLDVRHASGCDRPAWRRRSAIREAGRHRPDHRGRRRLRPLADRLRVGRDPDGKREDLLEARPANEGSGFDEEGGGCVQRSDSARAEGRGRSKRSPRRAAPDRSAENADQGRPDR